MYADKVKYAFINSTSDGKRHLGIDYETGEVLCEIKDIANLRAAMMMVKSKLKAQGYRVIEINEATI